jgi:uncharacterized protein YjbI with pentapeptide repeats
MDQTLNSFLFFSGILFWALIAFALLISFFGWKKLIAVTFKFSTGKKLSEALNNLYGELPNKIKKETIESVLDSLFKRLFLWRVLFGLMTLVIAFLTPWILINQNLLISDQTDLFKRQTDIIDSQEKQLRIQNNLFQSQNNLLEEQTSLFQSQNEKHDKQNSLVIQQNRLLEFQNHRLEIQNNLLEAERRGALIILLNNTIEQIDTEIKEQKKEDKNKQKDFKLSSPLIARIAALSQSLLPYKFLDGNQLTSSKISPERGQLLLTLIKSNLSKDTYTQIFSNSNFSYSYLEEMNLQGAYLDWANLKFSNLKGANLTGANLDLTELNYANLEGTELNGAVLTATYFDNANLYGSNLSGADLSSATFTQATLTNVRLNNSKLGGVSFNGAILKMVDFSDAREVEWNNLLQSKVLFKCKKIPPPVIEKIKKEKPCLLVEKGCSSK